MVKILKIGLDYFPIDVHFLSSRPVKRIMKREGDGALAVLVAVMSEIYADKGYYIKVDDLFYDDVSANLYSMNNKGVRRVVQLGMDYGLFDAEMFKKFNILTSFEIQNIYRYSTRRRSSVMMIPEYLIDGNEQSIDIQDDDCFPPEVDVYIDPRSTGSDVTFKDENVTFIPQSKEKQSKSTPSIPLEGEVKEEGDLFGDCRHTGNAAHGKRKRKEWTYDMIMALQPPADDRKRNFDGLRHDLQQFRIEPAEQYAIICKSDYGVIGHPVWKVLSDMRSIGSKLKMPGRYLLSKVN